MSTNDKLENETPHFGNTMLAVRSLSDLRVGNYIMKEGEEFKVTPYTLVIFEREPEMFNAVRLTDEHLKQFGADMSGDPTFILNTIDGTLFLVKNKNGQYYPNIFVSAEMSSFDAQCIGLNMIESVHELQNLYYALTGQELVSQNDR